MTCQLSSERQLYSFLYYFNAGVIFLPTLKTFVYCDRIDVVEDVKSVDGHGRKRGRPRKPKDEHIHWRGRGRPRNDGNDANLQGTDIIAPL